MPEALSNNKRIYHMRFVIPGTKRIFHILYSISAYDMILVSDIPAGDGNPLNLFYSANHLPRHDERDSRYCPFNALSTTQSCHFTIMNVKVMLECSENSSSIEMRVQNA